MASSAPSSEKEPAVFDASSLIFLGVILEGDVSVYDEYLGNRDLFAGRSGRLISRRLGLL